MARTKTAGKAARALGRKAAAGGVVGRILVVTTFRLYRDQLIGLQREALERRAQGAAGRVDASAVLREILEEHFEGRT